MSARSRDFAAGNPRALPVAPDYAISDYDAQINAQVEAGTDHDGVAKIRAGMLARQAQLQPLLTQTPAPLPDADEARSELATAHARLHAAIEARHAAEADHLAAVEALARGQQAVDTARSALAGLGDIDTLVAAWRAGRIAAGKPVDPLPEDLQHRRAERDHLLREITDSERTAALLSEQVAAARAALDRAGQRVDEAIAAVLDHKAELLSIEMLEYQQAAFDLLRRITALADLNINGVRYRLPAPVDRARELDPRPWGTILPADRDQPLRRWYAAVEQLRADADVDAPLAD